MYFAERLELFRNTIKAIVENMAAQLCLGLPLNKMSVAHIFSFVILLSVL